VQTWGQNQYGVRCRKNGGLPDPAGFYVVLAGRLHTTVYGGVTPAAILSVTATLALNFLTEGKTMTIKYKTLQIAALGLGIAGFSATGITTLARQAADNTRNNKGDNGKGGTTADQQPNNPADRELTKKIRKSIASDSSLSTYAHNIKVIVRDGMVTLKGPVHTEDEKNAIGAKASEAAGGNDKVQNELTVKAS
jgi:hyperosmotically inducible periplasmic protein